MIAVIFDAHENNTGMVIIASRSSPGSKKQKMCLMSEPQKVSPEISFDGNLNLTPNCQTAFPMPHSSLRLHNFLT